MKSVKVRWFKVIVLLLTVSLSGAESHAGIFGNIVKTVQKVAGDAVRETRRAGGDGVREVNRAIGDISREGNRAVGDFTRETERAGGDIAREWKSLPPEVQVGIIVVAAAAGGYFLAPVIGAEFTAGLAIDVGAGNFVTIPVVTTANSGALITGVGAGAAAYAVTRREPEKDSKDKEAKKEKDKEVESQEASKTGSKNKKESKKTQVSEIAQPTVIREEPVPVSHLFINEPHFEETEIHSPHTVQEIMQNFVRHYCFVAGTRVRTPYGHIAIENLKVDDLVVSCDFAGEQCSYQPIERVLNSESPVVRVHFEKGDAITTTPDHPFFVIEQDNFLPVSSLEKGMHVLTVGGESLSVMAIEDLFSNETVYNLEVGGFHNYYVSGAEGDPQDILVHNCDSHDCNQLSNFANVAEEMYVGLSVSSAAACAISAFGCLGGLATPGGQIISVGACPTTIPLCELALASGAAGAGANAFGNMMNEATGGGRSESIPRYQGAKPAYHVNQAHVKGSPQFNPKKTPLPADAADVYKRAVPDSPSDARHWYGKNNDGVIYRFSNANDGTAHFSGRSDVGDGIKNLTPYAKERLRGL